MNFRTAFGRSTIGCLIAAATAGFAANGIAADAAWRFHSMLPPSDTTFQLHKEFVSAVEKDTQGRVKIEVFGGSQLPYKVFDTVATVGTNKVQLADTALFMVAGTAPELNVLGLPFLATNFDEAGRALQVISPIVERELTRRFAKVGILTHYFFPLQKLWIRKATPGLDQIKGLKVRTKGPDEANMLRRLGGIPVSMAPEEVATSLQLGTLDGALTSSLTAHDSKWEKLTPYGLALDFNLGHIAVFYNTDEFRKLPRDVQTALRARGAAHGERLRRVMAENDASAARNLEAQGVRITSLSAQDTARARALMVPMWEEWAQKNGPVAQDLLAKVRATLGR